MRSLALAVLLGTLLPLIHASCWYKKAETDIKQCLYDKEGAWYPIGSRWRTKDCMDCSCHDNGVMSCCSAYSTPTRIPDDCRMQFNQKACEYEVFKKDDRSVSCPVLGAVV
uniref:Beta-microseminoprotein n=1 Tax=Esox lucius TaxID=8010 RepID=A0AAY5L4V3_ESOLU